MTEEIRTIAALEAAIGAFPPSAALKVIPYLDPGALRWIARSPLMFAGLADARTVSIILGAGERIVADAATLTIPGVSPGRVDAGMAFASLFLLPGIGETLRVNGTVAQVTGDAIQVTVDECYGHCAKALIRSGFWDAKPVSAIGDAEFLGATRFVVLATVSGGLDADLSPKGDPAGLMIQRIGDALVFADRPGNRRLDSFRNIVERPQVALAMLAPGCSRVGLAEGRAVLTTEAALRQRFEVAGKVPVVVVRVELERLEIADCRALADAALWPVQPVADIDPAKLFVEHVRRNRAEGAAAALARASLAIPGAARLLRQGLAKDYKDNLY